MKKIVCYRTGCNAPAKWRVLGQPVVHLCTRHMRELFPGKEVNVVEVARLPEAGPTEFKNEENGYVKA